MSTLEDIFVDMVVFLRDTLNLEKLSVNANQRRIALLQKILVTFPSFYTTDSHKSLGDAESSGECYEELDSSWSDSGTSSNVSRTYANTLPASSKHQKFSFFFGSSLGDSKSKQLNKTCIDTTTDFPSDASKRNSILSDSNNSLSPSSVKSEDSLEVKSSISASTIKYSAVKCGMLVRKEKTLFFEHSKRLWVALLGTTMFIYNTEVDTKPVHSINVDDYNARPIVSSAQTTTKKEFGFEIVCPGKKTYQFYSISKSEMETWILSINHSLPLPQTSSEISALSQASTTLYNDQLDSKLIEYSEKRNCDSCRYESAENPANRELPSLPLYLLYDTPNPVCRSVQPDRITDVVSSCPFNGFQETFYHSIDETITDRLASYDFPTRKDLALKNKENSNKHDDSPENNLYYNILDRIRINEKSENKSSSNEYAKNIAVVSTEKDHGCRKNGLSRIRQLIQKMEEINEQNVSCNKKVNSFADESKLLNSHHHTSPLSEEVYELVNLPTYVNINA